MRVIDLDRLSPEENSLLNELVIEIRGDFNQLVEFVGLEHENNIDWIVSSIASRNTFLSPLFRRCYSLALIKRILENDEDIGQIRLSDYALAKVLMAYFKENRIGVSIFCNESIYSRGRRVLIPFYNFASAVKTMFLRFISRSRTGKLKIAASKPVILLDTFVIKSRIGDGGSIHKGEYNDRYYPGLLDNLPEKEKKNIFYYPCFIGFRNPIEGIRLARKARNQFIIPDDFLNLRDYLFVLFHPIRLLRTELGKGFFRDFDVTRILRQERIMNCSNSSSVYGLINYRFAYRTAQEKVVFRHLVDWHENQVIDRGLIVGFRRFHPKTRITGYQGYIASKALLPFIYPTRSEFRSQAVPDRIGVVGRGLMEDIHEFCDDFEAFAAPAFRFNNVWEERKKFPEPNVFTILVALPIGLKGSANILRLLASVLGKFETANLRYWIKPHPTYGPEQIKPLLRGTWPEIFHFKTGDFNECVEGANLLIGNASSTCLEAMAKGVPVIVIGDCNGIVGNPVPEDVPDIMLRICITEDELISAVCFFKDQTKSVFEEYCKIGEQIKQDYFEPVTLEGIRSFLEISSSYCQSDK